MDQIAKQIFERLRRAQGILLISHQNPDPDTLGSALALWRWLNKIGRATRLYCATPINQRLAFLPQIENYSCQWSEVTKQNFDTVVTLDAGDLRYAGIAQELRALSPPPTIINIDHHATNELFGHYNLVDTRAAATAEVLNFFFKVNKIDLDEGMALALLAGLISDTTHWSNPATSATALRTGSELVSAGGNLSLIQKNMFQNQTIGGWQLWGRVFSRLEKNQASGLVICYLTYRDCRDCQATEEETEGLVNFLSAALDCPAVLLLKEKEDGTIKGSLRTRRDDLDMSALAKQLGGGGHKKAAGFTIPGEILTTVDKLKNNLKLSDYAKVN